MMRRLSLHARVALGALAMVVIALVVTGSSLMTVAGLTVYESLDAKMAVHVAAIESAIAPDGGFDPDRLAVLPELVAPATTWGWEVETSQGRWRGGEAIRTPRFRLPRIHLVRGTYSGDAFGAGGTWLHLRRRDTALPSGRATITVAAPDALIRSPLRRIYKAIEIRMALLATVMVLAAALLIYFALRPLRALGAEVGQISSGERQAVAAGQPADLMSLAGEINALVERNAAGLDAARNHAANLAHAIKTPLASLALQLEHEDASAECRALVQQIGKRIAHHLRRARSGAAGLGDRALCDVSEVVHDQVLTMERLFAARALVIENDVIEPWIASVDPEDMSEMLGNLLENACRFAQVRVRIGARALGQKLCVAIADDGPGIAPEDVPVALRPGGRLDESSTGYGFGLVIARELAELYGGSLELDRSAELGGLRVTVTLPRKTQV